MHETYCRYCGLKITHNSDGPKGWVSNYESFVRITRKKTKPEPYWGYCPGSKKLIELYPTFTDLIEGPENKRNMEAHEPISALEMLIRESDG